MTARHGERSLYAESPIRGRDGASVRPDKDACQAGPQDRSARFVTHDDRLGRCLWRLGGVSAARNRQMAAGAVAVIPASLNAALRRLPLAQGLRSPAPTTRRASSAPTPNLGIGLEQEVVELRAIPYQPSFQPTRRQRHNRLNVVALGVS